MSRITVLVASLWLTGCCAGLTPRLYPAAQSPRGIMGRVETFRAARIEMELLAVSDTALIVYARSGVMLVPNRVLRRLVIPDLRIDRSGPPADPETFERLRLHSRFPQGISPALLADLLERYGQPELVIASP